MEKFRYYVFDMLTLDEFDSGESKTTLEDRLQRAGTWIEKVNNVEKIRLVTHVEYTPEEFERQQTQASDLGWEGLMVRLNTTYKGKRSNDILKVKKFITEEYKVLGHEVGPMRIIDPGTGLETTIETLKSVIIEHKANQVNVGSGFTLDERQKFYADPKLIVGKIISVRYFEETPPNDEGKISLRFPTFVTLHGTKRTL
jgi:DNA ligase-1